MGVGQPAVEGVEGLNRSFWRGRRVLVTGHTGFKGAWLSAWLQRMGAEVTGYALAPEGEPNLFRLADIGHGMHSVLDDVRALGALTQTVREARPEVVLHLAAQALVRPSYEDPVGTYATNVMGTVNLLEAVRQSDTVRATVVVTSDKCYENREWEWGYRENEAMGGWDPYSSSKGCAELVAQAYRRSFFGGKAVATARAGNVIGGGDWAKDRLIPDVVRSLTAGKKAVIRNPLATRPWQHVLEPLCGYLTLAERLYEEPERYAEGWNFGPSAEDVRPVRWVVDRFVALWGGDSGWEVDKRSHPHEAHSLTLDCAKAAQRLQWRPALSLDEALVSIVDWYRRQSEGEPARGLVDAGLEDFETVLERNGRTNG